MEIIQIKLSLKLLFLYTAMCWWYWNKYVLD